MKIFGITINGNLIGQVLIGIFISWLIGLGISWINLFGHSGQAPLICAMAGGIYTVGRLVRQHRKLTKDNIAWLLNTADRVVESLVIDTQLIQLDTSLKILASLTMKTIATDKKTNEKRVLTAVLQKRRFRTSMTVKC